MSNPTRDGDCTRRRFRSTCCFHAALLLLSLVAFSESTPRFALILSGGGARGLSQIGVLKALESENLRPDLIVATSIGAIVGSLYAAGYCADSIAAMTRGVDWDAVFSNTAVRRNRFVSQKNEYSSALFELRFDYSLKPLLPTSISNGQAFYDLLAPLLTTAQAAAGSNFDSLPVPLRIITTDLLTGRRVVFSKGNICDAVRASCAVPLAFSPVETDSFLLVDGGVSANIPVETAREAGAAVVIAVDATSPLVPRSDLANPVKIVDQLMAIGITRIKNEERNMADATITPHLDEFKNTDFSNIDLLISRGFAEARRQLPRIRRLLASDSAVAALSDTLHPVTSAPHCSPPTYRRPVLSSLGAAGNRRTSGRLLLRATGLSAGDTLSPTTIRKTISSLYATDLFENVNFDIDSAGRGTILVEEKKYWRSRFGLRFDEFHLGEGYLEPAYENCFGAGIATVLHLQYGLRRERYSLQVSGNQFLSRNFASNLQLQIYSSKERISEIDTMITDSLLMMSTTTLHEHALRKNGITLAFGLQLGRFSMLSAGLRLEKFKVQQTEADMFGDILGTSFKKSLPYFSLRFTMDSMDKYPFPTSGTKLFISTGAATEAIGGRYTFLKCTGNISRYFTINKIHTFCPRFSFAWSSDVLPEVERGYIGGATGEERFPESSVYNYVPFSGLPPRSLIGDRFGIFRLEYRCEVKHNLYTDLHLDWGTAWEAKNHDFSALVENAPLGIGIGLAYQTLFGPIRISYGQLLMNSRTYLKEQSEFFYFSAGYDF